MKHSAQNGNALWVILIAIALLGAITAMFARSGGTSDDTGDYEQNSIAVSEIMRYAAGLETAVQNLLGRGCSENDISFYYAGEPYNVPGDYTNPAARTECEIFGMNGAGIAYKNIPAGWRAVTGNYAARSHFAAGHCVNGIGTGPGTTCNVSQTELRLVIGGLTKSLCLAINDRLGIANTGGNPPSDEDSVPAFIGSYTPASGGTGGVIGDDSTAAALPLKGRSAGCLMDDSGSTANQYFFYHVLISR